MFSSQSKFQSFGQVSGLGIDIYNNSIFKKTALTRHT